MNITTDPAQLVAAPVHELLVQAIAVYETTQLQLVDVGIRASKAPISSRAAYLKELSHKGVNLNIHP